MQRYLRPDLLKSAGVLDFDSWAATFGQIVTQVELAPEGGDSFRQSTRFCPVHQRPRDAPPCWHPSADIKTAEDPQAPVPALAPRPGDGQRAAETCSSSCRPGRGSART